MKILEHYARKRVDAINLKIDELNQEIYRLMASKYSRRQKLIDSKEQAINKLVKSKRAIIKGASYVGTD